MWKSFFERFWPRNYTDGRYVAKTTLLPPKLSLGKPFKKFPKIVQDSIIYHESYHANPLHLWQNVVDFYYCMLRNEPLCTELHAFKAQEKYILARLPNKELKAYYESEVKFFLDNTDLLRPRNYTRKKA